MRERQWLIRAAMLAGLVALCGCEMPREAEPTEGLWYRGKLERLLASPLAETHAAILLSIKDLKRPIVEERVNEVNGQVESRTEKDEPIVITMEKVGDTHTRVRIRVGLAGNRERSAALLNLIKTRIEYPEAR